MALRPLLGRLAADADFSALDAAIAARLDGVAPTPRVGASQGFSPYLLAALADAGSALADRPVLLVVPDDRAARALAGELDGYLRPRRVRIYPSRGTGYESQVAAPPHLVGLRIAALDALSAAERSGGRDPGDPPIVVAGAIALAERVPEASLRPGAITVHRGEEVSLDDLAELLVECAYERTDQVDARGQFALRGGILDVFGATEDHPARLELFGDEVESIRWFSTYTQRSLGETELLELEPAAELDSDHLADPPFDRFADFLDLIDPATAVITVGQGEIPSALADHWTDVTATIEPTRARRIYADVEAPLADRVCASFGGLELSAAEADPQQLDLDPNPAASFRFRAAIPASPARNLIEAEAELEKQVRSGYLTVVVFEHSGEAQRAAYTLDRLSATLLGDRLELPPRVDLGGSQGAAGGLLFADSSAAALIDGFVAPSLRLSVIPIRRLVHRRRAAAAQTTGRGTLSGFADLSVGDFVVHCDHGIARFEGFETRAIGGVVRDYLKLAYKGDDRVFSPADQMDKISRYVGSGGIEPALSALGGKRWAVLTMKARRAAREMAGELINLYAERRSRRGHAFPPDGEWQMRLEADFPYRETADQIDAIEAVKADMESERPMDRLICGDVGYGKTEVALRAAAKCAADAKQVMVLAPTTILARQHLGTFRERMRDFPYQIEMVSRLRSAAENKATLERFADGKVDIVIGTHRLLSRDVRAKELGLLILDEEQRFGVKQKELLRHFKLKVDVLTLSATPIPRTLQMSLAGLRDISVIETPPEGRRPVRTFVGPYDAELVKRSIERELDRGGQAFYLHNRVATLDEEADRIRALVPRARVIEAHGRLEEGELESRMLRFLRGDADVLVATTIIESGLDIPNANTLIVERADTLGLAQAYQIRGRVGRSRERAFAYMLYPSEQALSPEAGARLATLADHTELGSGFAIAMRDLELRGAGDLLGAEQSGHVAAIGFELYVEMLEQAVEAMQREGGDADAEPPAEGEVRIELGVDAYVLGDYVPFEAAKIDIHRRIAGARDATALRELRAELRDRFGPEPEPITNLLTLQSTRIILRGEGVCRLEQRGAFLSVGPIDLDSERVAAIREAIPEVIYAAAEKTLKVRVEHDIAVRLAAAVAITEALAKSRSAQAVR